MSNTESDEDLEAIRQRKAEELSRRDSAASEPVHVTDASHLSELLASGVTVVDFHAEWCGPCKMLSPIMKEIAAETGAMIAKVDIDDHQAIAQEYQVQGVPTVIMAEDGELAERWVGVQPKDTYKSAIDAAV
jgi:thioredoxin 1